jgi:mannose-6-phosphate isomerase-like protein (cupin superfamily)
LDSRSLSPILRVKEPSMSLARFLPLVLLLLLGAGHASSQTSDSEPPPGFVHWTPERMTQTIARLDRELGDKPLVFEAYGNYERHSVYLVLRGKTSTAELHETEADLYVVRRGRATLAIGGELVDPETRPRKQVRAPSIRGGHRREIGPGDVVYIPVAVPHQLILPAGESFLYDLTKFNEEPLGDR